jgi:hypothetical protein
MGNSNTKEARASGYAPGVAEARLRQTTSGDQSTGNRDSDRDAPRGARNRSSRADLGFLGLAGTSRDRERDRQNAPFERRETRQEREARRLERERAARVKERERSIREEHVDGGYLVTMGTYTGTEDFSKPVVRQLQVRLDSVALLRGVFDGRLLKLQAMFMLTYNDRLSARWLLSGVV